MNKKQKVKSIKISSIRENEEKPLFCTECGEKLEDFCFSDEAKNLKILRKHHKHCKKTNKFNGGQCAKLFIAEPTEPSNLDD